MRKHTIRPKLYIFCNGDKAEPIYFQEFKDHLKSHAIKVKHKGFKRLSPWDLVDRVVVEKENLQNRNKFSDEDGDRCWCVFDVDDYWDHNSQKFVAAVKKAKKMGINLAWSNECFELWYLFHFQVLQTGIPRRDYETKLKRHFRNLDGKNYTKNSSVFRRLIKNQSKAVLNAKKTYKANQVQKNPSTAVFKLVEEINKYFG